jgi:hypothetical protein
MPQQYTGNTIIPGFTVILFQLDLPIARKIAVQICTIVEDHPFRVKNYGSFEY